MRSDREDDLGESRRSARSALIVTLASYTVSAVIIIGTIWFLANEAAQYSALKEQEAILSGQLASEQETVKTLSEQADTRRRELNDMQTERDSLTAQIDALKAGLARAQSAAPPVLPQVAQNEKFYVFLHYRDDKSYSKEFAQVAQKALTDAGFLVSATRSGSVRVQDKAGQGVEGPHIDWFEKPGDTSSAANESKQAAQRVADILNRSSQLPEEFSQFTVKPDGWPQGASPDQARYLGVWF